MNKERHTQGPWETSLHKIVKSDGDGYMFSGGEYEVYPPLGESGPICVVHTPEDARLIAAAPELLEVCHMALRPLTEEAESIFECHTVGGNLASMDADVREDYDGLLALIGDIKSAIAKAEGLNA